VVPWSPGIGVSREKRTRLSESIGDESVETLLISATDNRLLYSDDLWLRGLGKGEWGIRGVWTQAILLFGLQQGKISRDQYDSAAITLVCAGYSHTSIDGYTVAAAARKASWQPGPPFDNVIATLSGPDSEMFSTIVVVLNAIYELWKSPVPPSALDYLVLRVFDAFIQGRPAHEAMDLLERAAKKRFQVNPIVEQDVLRLINCWRLMQKPGRLHLP
jgi:hypothetical protein